MNKIVSIIIFLGSLTLSLSSCTGTQKEHVNTALADTTTSSAPKSTNGKREAGRMTDPRDGEVYATIKIGEQTWMAENLRFDAPGSMLNPENPSKAYGRLYRLLPAQTACPEGWHLPSDSEWEILELAHGMPASFVGKGGWRGEHGKHMKSTNGWDEDGNGTDSLGFNVLPAGYYFSGQMGSVYVGMQGVGYSAAFWSSMEDSIATARFLFSPRLWVNKWEDKGKDTGAGLACRCVLN